MSLVLGFAFRGDSWIHQADPRVKLLFTAGSIFLLLLIKNVVLIAVGLLIIILGHLSARAPISRLSSVAKALLPVSILMFLLRMAFYPAGELLWKLGPLQITAAGVAEGAALAFRILAMGYAVMLWLTTTEEEDLLLSLTKLGLPYSLALSLALALRFIPSVGESYSGIADAYQARGLELEGLSGLRWIRARVPIFTAMIIAAFRMSEELARSLEARGYGAADIERTSLRELDLRRSDWILAAGTVIIFVILIYANLVYGLGRAAIMLLPN
jgi:energy-coupling factor transport system permease protein